MEVRLGPTGRPIKIWALDADDGVMEQANNLSELPFVISHIALMPDAHRGYGMPIGGVLFADKVVVPGAVGVDIGCGVQLIETNLNAADIDPESIRKFLAQVQRDVPVGNGPQAQHKEVTSPYEEIARDAEMQSYVLHADAQLGTLGGGNHFLELQTDEADGSVWFMLHSGSRSVGKKTCDRHSKIAQKLNARWHSKLPDKELAYLPTESQEGQDYWDDMSYALLWAEENRRRMAAAVIEAFAKVWKATAKPVVDIHHNYATWENHGRRNGVVHRKGAVRAAAGDLVLIPGSMGTASYVATGLGNPESFETCQHGAGRARGRRETTRMTNIDEMNEALGDVILVTPDRASVLDESPIAYKDIEVVMAQSRDLVIPNRKLLPLGVVKG